jgi:hypothetical protein
VAPARPVTPAAPRTVVRSAPAPVHRGTAKHRSRRHHPHHTAAAHGAHAAKPAATKPAATKTNSAVPAAPAASVDGGSGQLVLLGLAMLAMTAAVFTHVGWRRRHGSV